MRMALFDWNGTLFNDSPVWYASVKEIFLAYGKQPPTMEEYFRELEGDYLKIYRSRGIFASRDEINEIYEKAYVERVERAELFPGVAYTLGALSEKGVIMGIVTGQKDYLVIPFLYKFGIGPLFSCCEYHALDKKSSIRLILENAGIAPEECCFVGDAPADIRHGNAAGVITIAFLNGHTPEDLMLNAEPKLTIRNFEKIISII
jgi:HAD superfamily hydrolase (TIGR01509 family)